MSDDASRRDFLQFLAEHDVPAFLRRSQVVDEAWQSVLHECRLARDKLLDMPRLRLGILAVKTAHRWDELAGLLSDPSMASRLRDYHAEWQPVLRTEVQAIENPSMWSRSIEELIHSFNRFNQRWQEYAEAYDFGRLNALRDGYNKYYVIEKSCAFDSDRIGAEGFTELEPATAEEILRAFPLLELPRLR